MDVQDPLVTVDADGGNLVTCVPNNLVVTHRGICALVYCVQRGVTAIAIHAVPNFGGKTDVVNL